MTHRPRRRFGQNFLHDQGIISKILRNIDAKPQQNIVEIGPGQGALTWPLLAAAGALTVIEIDRDLAAALRHDQRNEGLSIIEQDVLTVDFTILPAPMRVVGNLPYNISTPLLFHLLTYADHIQDMYFMLQAEVVDRMAAEAGSSDYGRLSIGIQYHCEVERVLRVPPGCFNPAPKVDSAVVRLTPRPPQWALHDRKALDRVVRAAFNQRRKTLRNGLRKLVSDEQFASVGVDSSWRPQQLAIEDYVKLANLVAGEQ